ncbi:TatD family hydrolase [Myroides sp. JBRI-B21084]|uniref:TatD family hydrolase n=1 Tax=Myroides sp. JBRI-B21084 TaxID=3119977 RepID=UPI0026E28BBC|nr:TatD family hydrolase [Paenimyroides cloacae]WKW47408.1 TatD family hydrolase [Paenimyroides cloacae]
MYVNLHTHKSTETENVIEIVNQYPNEIDTSTKNTSIGIHPWYIKNELIEKEISLIEENCNNKNCKAIGECGLDKRIEISIDIQKKALIPQLLLAEKHQKPVILHCVAAFQEIIALKQNLQLTIPMVIHGFSKNLQVAESLLNHGFYLSFGKYLMTNENVANVLKNVPLNKIFLETDSSTFSIFEVYSQAERILQRDLTEIIVQNYNRVFNP